MSQFQPTDFTPGQRVRVLTYSESAQAATFLGYDDETTPCPSTHLFYPGMRMAIIHNDRYGRVYKWEKDLAPLVPDDGGEDCRWCRRAKALGPGRPCETCDDRVREAEAEIASER